jgi:hypothetical protein
MEKLITFTLIRLFTKSNNDAIRIFKAIDSLDKKQTPKSTPPKVVKTPKPILQVSRPTPIKVVNTPKFVSLTRELHKPIDKKEELLESLSYLKNKKVKTKQDKESINIINSILKNMV